MLAAMHEQGYITDREASLALSQEIKAVRDVAGGSGRYVADWVMDQLPSYVGALDQRRRRRDHDRPQDADAGRAGARPRRSARRARSTASARAPSSPWTRTAAVKAMVGGRDYAQSQFNRAVDAHRQPGSAFKPFVYLAALESGMVPETVRIDQPVSINGWTPENYSRDYLGPVTLQSALALSLNTVSAQLAAEVGPQARRRGTPGGSASCRR